LNPVPRFVSVSSHIIANPVPYSTLSDPSGGSVIYESGTGKICWHFRGYRSNIFNSDPRIEILFMADRLLGTDSAVTDLKRVLRIQLFFYGSVPLDLSF